MKTLASELDKEIIEDTSKTIRLLKWLNDHGMLDETMVAMWEIEENNKRVSHCSHCLPNGETALYDAAGYTNCSICGSWDYPGEKL